MKNYVDGKVIIITGSAAGFGFATAKKLAALGGIPIISDLNEEAIKKAVAEIKADGGYAGGFKCDVTKYDDVKALVAYTVENFKKVDVLVNNAGTMPLAFWADHEKAMHPWETCIDVNLKGSMYGVAAVNDLMYKQGFGHVIFLASVMANYPVQGAAVYQATKIGVRYFANCLRIEAKGKIKVTTVNPTGVNSTNLMGTVVNLDAGRGCHGAENIENIERRRQRLAGELPPGASDLESVQNMTISADEMADSIVYCINQPLGVNISEITVRASNETYCI